MTAQAARVFNLPDLGEGLQDAEIVAWHVAEGDHVVEGQPLVSVETDKAVVEVPSPRAGRIAQLLAPVEARVPVGAPLVAFTEGAEADAGAVVGQLPQPPSPPGPAAEPRVRAAPAVRALAQELGVDLAAIAGTGPDGAVTRADVERARAARTPGAETLRGMRRAMAERMARAGASVVPATVTDEADITTWDAAQDPMARLLGAIVEACAAEPALNAAFDPAGPTRALSSSVHVGIAVDTPDGLIAPVLRDAEQLSEGTLVERLGELVAAARSRTLAPAALRGATITLSNFGAIGGRFASLVVTPPQVAILGAGRAHDIVAPAENGFAARRMLPLSLTFDHRAVTGGEAARFLMAAKASLERPRLRDPDQRT
jgi:pyruvate dehydrogenase E2 component (dihydrolipoamide acetyltransferase)